MLLERKKYLGIKYQTIKYNGGFAFIITSLMPNSPATKAGLQIDDMLIQINRTSIHDSSLLTTTLATKEERITFLVLRNGHKREIICQLEKKPFEENSLYDTLICGGIRLRMIITYPPIKQSKYPLVIFIPGIYLMSVDFPFSSMHTYKQLIDKFTESGYMTIRVERPGIGDSEGKRNTDLGFHYECLIYQTLLKHLTNNRIPKCDLNNIIFMGYSMGGVIAPIVSNNSNVNVAGIITYGTVFSSVTNYLLENAKRNSISYNASIYKAPFFSRFLYYYLHKNLSPAQLHKINPQYDKYFNNGETFLGRHYTYFQELNQINLKKTWLELKEMSILIMAGCLDSLISLNDQKALYDLLVSQSNCKQSVSLKVINANHDFCNLQGILSPEGITEILIFLNSIKKS
ncbi:MAG: alpha/beta hydrolase [Lachnospiraceae bacterium]|nr:alpha/beta hydrolase [Lachnospiraceae bacterium]